MKNSDNADNAGPSLTNIVIKIRPRVMGFIGMEIIKAGIGIIHNVAL